MMETLKISKKAGQQKHFAFALWAFAIIAVLALTSVSHALDVSSPTGQTTSVAQTRPVTSGDFIRALTPSDNPPQLSRGIGIVKDQPQPISSQVALQIQFAFGSAQLTPQAMMVLCELGKAINSKELSSYRFLIVGYTDAIGSPYANQILSERRAWAVVSFLEANFPIEPGRLIAAGMGATDFADPNNPCNCINRRVEISNIGQFQHPEMNKRDQYGR